MGNRLMEAVLRNPELGEERWRRLQEEAMRNALYRRVMKEALLSDVAGALGRVHDTVWEAAKPATIGREIITVVPTKEPLVRFPKARLGKAYIVGETAPPEGPERYETTDVRADLEIAAKAEFSQRFIEDASWNVMEHQIAELGRSIAELETEKVYELYNSIADSDLAGGSPLSPETANTLSWNDVVALWSAVKGEDFNPDVLVLHPDQYADLWKDDKFIHSFYWGEQADVSRGILGGLYLGMRIVVSTKCASGTAFAIDSKAAAAMIVQRELITEPYQRPDELLHGCIASERIGLGVLRSRAVAKMTGC